jgi:Meiotic cell cortex C-terminal pleckstrin homology
LQAILAEKEESLKLVTQQKSKLEVEAEGFHQRLRSLDESEHRYKDENWNLETQIHEHIAAAKESADREKRLVQTLNALQAEKAAAQKELDEIKLGYSRLAEDHAAAAKHHEVELGGVKRNMVMVENERGALQRKVEELTGQNQELAIAIAQQRARANERDQARGLSDEDFETAADNATPEHSPPPSPVKGTPRHSMLESETLKSSLHHAHRTIQNLKSGIHREKTEKLELKRLLQDARDELDVRRGDSGLNTSGVGKRTRKSESREFKKPLKPGQLGGLRSSKSEISIDEDANWEDQPAEGSVSPLAAAAAAAAAELALGPSAAGSTRGVHESSDNFETAHETSDAFETANERGTETEDFHTGAEEISGSDELTETEDGVAYSSTLPGKKPSNVALVKPGNRQSFQSTASLSGDEYSYEDVKTPIQTQPQRLRLKVNRGGFRRSRVGSEEPHLNSSPASFATSSKDGTPQPPRQSLFLELGDLEGSDEDESVEGTPSRRGIVSPTSIPASRPGTSHRSFEAAELPPQFVQKPSMVDSGMMTDAWELEPPTPQASLPSSAEVGLVGASAIGDTIREGDSHEPPALKVALSTSDAASQCHDDQLDNLLAPTASHINARPPSTYNDMSSQYDPNMDEKLAIFPSPPTSPTHTPRMAMVDVPLSISAILSEHVEPIVAPEIETSPAPRTLEILEPIAPTNISPLELSIIQFVATEPISPLQSPRPESLMILRDGFDESVATPLENKPEEPKTPEPMVLDSMFGWNKGKRPGTPIIAEDETRQSANQSPEAETPESQRPFRELSVNTNERATKKPKVNMTDESSQTALTAQQIENMLKEKIKRQEAIIAEDTRALAPGSSPYGSNIMPTRRSQESIGSTGRARAKMADPDLVHDHAQSKRPGSSGSNRGSSSGHPPLPSDHKQVIAAAAQRVGSSSGGQGSMGPPPLPASAYRASSNFRPRTPVSNPQNQISASVGRGGTTPRAARSSAAADVHSPTGTGARSRRSSVSSFASELDNRFNIRANGGVPHGIAPNTDPRMIQAITQTMIGEYLWKYTRKTGRGEMSENRHRRYFWVHPYTRTLYWSDRDPSQAGRGELRAKSVAIEAVRVITDDNPMPPGLHRKSLVILTPGRAIKFTASTGQRHETWFNALSYLLLRTANDTVGDTEETTHNTITHEDVEEFNPGHGIRTTRRGPTSLSSYNSRTTRNESPTRQSVRASMNLPTLAHTSTSSRPSGGTFSRLSNYWKPKESVVGSFSSRRSRHSLGVGGSIYEASEVHDSAEELREIIEKQDRESDRLENVRACCDGKFNLHIEEGKC